MYLADLVSGVCVSVRTLRVDSGCVYAALGPYPSGQVCCQIAALTESAAAAPGSSQTHSPTVRSLFITCTQEYFINDTTQ